MFKRHSYYVYIMTNHSGTLYIGITNDIKGRIRHHKRLRMKGFTKKYKITRLVYYEETTYIHAALEREKELKGWVRKKKVELIESANPGWI